MRARARVRVCVCVCVCANLRRKFRQAAETRITRIIQVRPIPRQPDLRAISVKSSSCFLRIRLKEIMKQNILYEKVKREAHVRPSCVPVPPEVVVSVVRKRRQSGRKLVSECPKEYRMVCVCVCVSVCVCVCVHWRVN